MKSRLHTIMISRLYTIMKSRLYTIMKSRLYTVRSNEISRKGGKMQSLTFTLSSCLNQGKGKAETFLFLSPTNKVGAANK